MAAKKKPESKRGGTRKPDEKKLTFKRLPVNLGKTDYDDLLGYEGDKGISTTTEAIRQLIRDGLKMWKQNRDRDKGSDSSSR